MSCLLAQAFIADVAVNQQDLLGGAKEQPAPKLAPMTRYLAVTTLPEA